MCFWEWISILGFLLTAAVHLRQLLPIFQHPILSFRLCHIFSTLTLSKYLSISLTPLSQQFPLVSLLPLIPNRIILNPFKIVFQYLARCNHISSDSSVLYCSVFCFSFFSFYCYHPHYFTEFHRTSSRPPWKLCNLRSLSSINVSNYISDQTNSLISMYSLLK